MDVLSQIIIPFLDKYPFHTVIIKDYSDWKLAWELIKKGEHLTKQGADKIKIIKKVWIDKENIYEQWFSRW